MGLGLCLGLLRHPLGLGLGLGHLLRPGLGFELRLAQAPAPARARASNAGIDTTTKPFVRRPQSYTRVVVAYVK